MSVVVLKGDGVVAVLGELRPRLVLDLLTVLGYGYDSIVLPRELNLGIGVTAILNAFKLTRGSRLRVVLLGNDGVDTRAELVGDSHLVNAACAELVGESVKLDSRAEIVGIKSYPSLAAVRGLLHDESLNVALCIGARIYLDNKLLFLCVLGERYRGCATGDNEIEGLTISCVVDRYNGVSAACGKGEVLAKALDCHKLVFVLVNHAIDTEHSHFVNRIGDRDSYLVLEEIGSVKGHVVYRTLANRVLNGGSVADNDYGIVAGVAVLVKDGYGVSALGFDYSTDKGFTVKEQADVCTELNRICKDSLALGVGVKVLALRCGRGSFLPIVVGLDGVLGILGNYLCQTLCGEIRHLLGGSTRLLVDEVSAVSGICAVLLVHRNTRIPSCAAPSAVYNKAVLTEGCKFKCLFVRSKCEDIAVLVGYLVVFFLKRRGLYVLLGGYKLGAPYVACGVGYNNLVNARINGGNELTVSHGFAVDGYALNGCVEVSITVRPSDLHVAVCLTARHTRKGCLFLSSVDDYGVVARGVACIVKSVEGVLAHLGELCSRNISGKGGAIGSLDIAILTADELDILAIGIRAAADCLAVHIELSRRDLTVNLYGVVCRGVTRLVGCIEGVSAFCGQLCTRSVRSIGGGVRLLHIDICKTDIVARNELNIACVGGVARRNNRSSTIKNARRLGGVKSNRYHGGLITRFVCRVEGVSAFGSELSAA